MNEPNIIQSNYDLSSPTGGQEAIILAGGLGTRLRSVVPDLPKCMAMVAGKPFLSYVIDYLRMQGIQRFIFSLGYKHEVIEPYLKEHYPTLQYQCVVEKEPLGTGGAIQLALKAADDEDVLVTNGDTLFKVNVPQLTEVHYKNNAACTLALKPLEHFDRYGAVLINDDGAIQSFQEKQYYEQGLINGGIYIINKNKFLEHGFPERFSMEKDYLEKYSAAGEIYGCLQTGYFIDIGIPEDFEKAQTDLAKPIFDLKKIDTTWTLFLDRDGVINDERIGEYVLHWQQFIFSEGVLNALQTLSKKFHRIILVSNQRGVGRGLMTENDLQQIHNEMLKEVQAAGGHIDKIYYSTGVENAHFHRKPNPGMALQAMADFPNIDWNKAIMVGNKLSDMRFGRSAGMYTVFLATTNPETPFPHPDIDMRFNLLAQLAAALQS